MGNKLLLVQGVTSVVFSDGAVHRHEGIGWARGALSCQVTGVRARAGGAGPPGEVLKRRGELHRDGVCTTPSCRTEAKGARAQPPFLVLLIPLLREASQGSIRSN